MKTDFDFQPTLVGERLSLRPLAAKDWGAIYALAKDPLVWEQHPARDRWQEPVFRGFFDDMLASGGALVAQRKDTDEVIGWSRYSADHVQNDEIEIGWTMLGRAWWGGLHNGEMKALMLAHAFAAVPRVVFRVGADNRRSRRAVEKIGGQLMTRAFADGPGGAPYVGYSIERADWLSRGVAPAA